MTKVFEFVRRKATAKRGQEHGLKDMDGLGLLSSAGSFASLRMTAGTNNGEDRQQQQERQNAGFLRVGMQQRSGFLHCAAHDETVSSFGRNDGSIFA
jgi:hypothetical protein